jgi:hypothetical protein
VLRNLLRAYGVLAVAAATADARKTACAARLAARTKELPARAAADAGNAALATRTAIGALVLAAGAAVAARVAASTARVLLEDNVSGRCSGHGRAGDRDVSRSHRCRSDRRSDSPG